MSFKSKNNLWILKYNRVKTNEQIDIKLKKSIIKQLIKVYKRDSTLEALIENKVFANDILSYCFDG
jgi:hypothetical protein